MSSLNIATRALNTNLAALQVIGHNIANVNTAGYSRQTVQLQSAGYQSTGGGYFGKGVELTTVERAYNEHLTREARVTASSAAGNAARLERLQQLESVFPMGDQGLGVALNDMLNAWSDLVASPSNSTARVVVISRADAFAARLRDTAGQIDLLRNSTQQQVGEQVDAINRLATELASVNKRIIETSGGSHTPNDLFDQRDKLLADLSQYTQLSVVPGEGGTANVFIAGSQPLVLGTQTGQLATQRDPADTSRIQVVFRQGAMSTPLDATALGSGELAGTLRFLNEDLQAVQNQVGRMALAASEIVNAQHRLGVDLAGAMGGDFFVPLGATAGLRAPTNAPPQTATASASVSNPQALIASDYELRVEAGGFSVVRLSDNAVTTFPTLPAVVDGLSFDIGAGPAAVGDSFRIRPFEAAARNLQVAITAPQNLAVASPVLVTPGTANSGGLGVESLYAVSDSPNLTDPVTLTFNADGTFSATGLGPGNPAPDNPGPPASYNFTPGQPIQLNGWSLTLRGNPTAGDSFSIGAAPSSTIAQNAGNANGVLALRAMATFEGATLSDGYVSLFADVGARVQNAKFSAEFTRNVALSAEQARANVAGVNLDEEAARLLQFQQAYQASAKFLQIAQSTFDSLLQTIGR
ncbi:MAG: flagellar hook-associated protein FlgK [Hydrogenophaga sp.]|uniref:flagellar hook-associated protein FlgK n=1 Tax=Hydrogenophaga intermedia TaxID=65786 RepID=UPI002044B735|nr:flagellar hook-associated protein FlgK [Hydrogenophaga intermedia]MCM3564879.1 flagellar hook-associated protein FlgK [Hydrogenophaga intermedia]